MVFLTVQSKYIALRQKKEENILNTTSSSCSGLRACKILVRATILRAALRQN